jgi:SOS-response transcriptional repressor LexA
VQGKCYVKKRGSKELISLNPEHPNIPLDETSRVMGRVVGKYER